LIFDKTKTANLRTILFPILVVVLVLSQTVYGAGHQVTRVHDGDTLKVRGDSGEFTIRLVGVDAPENSRKKLEPGQPFSQKATEYLAGLVLNQSVDVKECGVDRYGRILGIVVLEGTDINQEMLKMGLAEVYRGKPVKGFDLAPYLDAEREAREAKKGIWVQGIEYVSPRDWRKGQSIGLRRDMSSAPRLGVISGEEGLGY
jgi:endonuclease YncB( thermonuclease family)